MNNYLKQIIPRLANLIIYSDDMHIGGNQLMNYQIM